MNCRGQESGDLASGTVAAGRESERSLVNVCTQAGRVKERGRGGR